MEVTNENFEASLPELFKRLDECDFCSIDCELSGITNHKILNSFDSPRIRYEKIRKNDEKYLIIQFGMCLFKRIENSDKPNSYVCNAYNCFLFPRSQNAKFSKDNTFSCLNSSIEFLSEQNFDFNKVFGKGITFMNKDHEEVTRHRLIEKIEERKIPKSTLYPSNSKEKDKNIKEQIDKIMSEIDEFVNEPNETTKEIKFSELYFQRLRYENKFLENKERMMRLIKIESNNQVSELDILDKEIGFSKFIWQMAKSNKLIVGHNMLTDIMQIMRQFFSSPLPENFEDFKSMTNSLFPNLLDTKYMASIAPLKELISSTALGEMDKILSKDVFPQINIENSQYSTKNEKLHEAGYDAFLTGCCYLRMLHYLESFNSSKEALINFYSNKIFLMKNYDILFIDFKNSQDEPKRENVFYIEFPPYWETQDIYDLFSPFGAVHVGWIDERSSFVALQNLDNVKKAAGQLVGVAGRDYKVYFYQTYINQLSKGRQMILNNQTEVKNNNNNNNNNGNGSEKRKRDSPPPKTITTMETSTATITSTAANEIKKEIKKIKSNENATEKPFEECMNWY